MADNLDEIRRAAFDNAAASGTLADIEKAASIAKALAEAEKSASDTRNARRQLRLQVISSLSAILVPVVSLLALVGTIYIQGQQLKETQAQNRTQQEDTQWRDFLNSLSKSPDVFDSDVTVAPRLRSFFHSTRYGDQARDISIRLMGRLTNAAGFRELYDLAFANVTPDGFSQILGIEREITATANDIESECANLTGHYNLPAEADHGLCTLAIPVQDFTKFTGPEFPTRVLKLRQALQGSYAVEEFISPKIASYLRENYSVGAATPERRPLDLAQIVLANTELLNVDLSNADIQGTRFQNVNLSGSDLRTTRYLGVSFFVSSWWDVKTIDQSLLDLLIEYQYPFFSPSFKYAPSLEPTRNHYSARIAELCQPMRAACKPENLKFGPRAMSGLGEGAVGLPKLYNRQGPKGSSR
jgi:hypothetical protein